MTETADSIRRRIRRLDKLAGTTRDIGEHVDIMAAISDAETLLEQVTRDQLPAFDDPLATTIRAAFPRNLEDRTDDHT